MKLNRLYDYKPLERTTGKNGRRYIVGETSPLPSVTTILSATKDLTPIIEWQKRVGVKEANQITTEAANIGTTLHKNLENYILTGANPTGLVLEKILSNLVIKKGLSKVDEIWGTEVALYASGLYAGTTDAVGIFRGKPAIIDFKNSRRPKKEEWIADYFMQLVAYGLAHDEMFGTAIRRGVVMIACRTGEYQEFIIEDEKWDYYLGMWCEKLHEYHTKFGTE